MYSEPHFSFKASASPWSNQIPLQLLQRSTTTFPLKVPTVNTSISAAHLGQIITLDPSMSFVLQPSELIAASTLPAIQPQTMAYGCHVLLYSDLSIDDELRMIG
jgi:hypothetical protein